MNGLVAGTGEILLAKQASDGVIVNVLLLDNIRPAGLELTLIWPSDMPKQKIDFVLIAPNDGHSYMCLFRYGPFGPELVYSENSNPLLINDLLETNSVVIKEQCEHQVPNREYTCSIKHCSD